jgi:putative redox protein
MIASFSQAERYKALFSNGKHQAYSDTTSDKGGGNNGFRPHELLEAALASCINMTIRMHADQHGIPLERVVTTVTLDRGSADKALFKLAVELEGNLTSGQRAALLEAARHSSVAKTLSRGFAFEYLETLVYPYEI